MNLDYLQISVLAVLQGFTEFLPISSSGHLILPSLLLGWNDQGLTFDVAVHLGSLLAVLAYFQQDFRKLLWAWLASLRGSGGGDDARLAWLLIIATIPGGLAGLALNGWVEQYARALPVIAVTSLLFAGLLYWADRASSRSRDMAGVGLRDALVIGCAQALALIPGTSRSGVTMTAALFCNLSRQAAARFSFLLSVPIILASGALKTAELANADNGAVEWLTLLYATALSALVAFTCIHLFLRLIERIGFLPFVIYRVVLGVLLLSLYLSG